MRLEEEVSAEEYGRVKKNLLDTKNQLKEKLDDDHFGSLTWLELAEKFFENCYQAREIMESDDFLAKRNLVKTVGSNLFLRDKKLEFSFRRPYDLLLKPGIRDDVQGR